MRKRKVKKKKDKIVFENEFYTIVFMDYGERVGFLYGLFHKKEKRYKPKNCLYSFSRFEWALQEVYHLMNK